MDRKPKVSVVVPCYNAERTVEQTLCSLEAQTFQDFEVILVDNASTDDTQNILNRWSKAHAERFLVCVQEKRGVSAARNMGIARARGEYLAFVDADDVLKRSFLAQLVEAMESRKVDLVVAKLSKLVDDASAIDAWQKQETEAGTLRIEDKNAVFSMYLEKRRYALQFAAALYRRDLIKEQQLTFPEEISYGEDTDFFCRYLFCCDGGCCLLDCELYGYRKNAASATHQPKMEMAQNIQVFANMLDLWGVDAAEVTIVERATWSCAKDVARGEASLYREFCRTYPVRLAMKKLLFSKEEWFVRGLAALFLISPALFRRACRFLTGKMR